MTKEVKYLENVDLSKMYLEEKIDLLLKQNNQLLEYMKLFLPDLSKEKDVIHFLAITKNTYNKYIKENILQEGIHYFKNDKQLTFDVNEIIKFKSSGQVGRKRNDKKKDNLESLNGIFNIMNMSKSA